MFVNEKKLEELISKYYKAIFAFVSKHISSQQDAEDIVQKTFENAYLHKIKKAPYSFLKQVALNLIRNYYRKSERNNLLRCDLERLLRNPIDTKKLSKLKDLKDYLRELVYALPEQEKTIIELRYFMDPPLKHKEIQEILGITPPTCKKYHNLAMEKLRKEIERYLDR